MLGKWPFRNKLSEMSAWATGPGSGESWFEPRRGNEARPRPRSCRASPVRGVCEELNYSSPMHLNVGCTPMRFN